MTVTDAIIKGRPTCFHHPTKVIFLDDNRAFLDAMELEFGNQINMVTISNPYTAIQEVDNQPVDISQSVFKIRNDVNTDTSNNCIIHFEIGQLLNLIYDQSRFDNVAVLVVDYEMPDINGLELCQKLETRNVFKIMLTAAADKDTAIRAFNNSVIDKFLFKTSDDLYSEITLAVQELSRRYFSELSRTITHGHGLSTSTLFDNVLYREIFTRIAFEAQAVEYYLVDNSGSFLFLDTNANPTWLIVRNQNELKEQFDLLQGYDLPDELMSAVARQEKILFLLSEKEYKKPVSEWVDYLFDATKLDDNYYYSVVHGALTDSIDWSRVVSHSAYLAQRSFKTWSVPHP